MDTKALRQKILDLAIRGKLVPQDPNDEPASVLLERIREEKQQMFKEGKLKKKDIKNDSVIFKGEDNLHYEKFMDGSVKCIEDEIPFEVPDGWRWTRLGSITDIIQYGLSNSAETDGKYRLLRITDIQDGCVNWNTVPFTSTDHPEKYLLHRNDIVFARTGATIGKSFLITDLPYDSVYASYLIRIRLIKGILPNYIYQFFNSYCYWKQITNKAVGVGQPNCNGTLLKGLFIPLPPEDEQKRIVPITYKLLKIVNTISKQQNQLTKLVQTTKRKILNLAIQGQLVPQDPNDEPASVLLERIRADKEELIKHGKIKRDKKESVIFKGDDNSYYETIANKTICIDDEIPFDLPKNWSWCRLKSLAAPQNNTFVDGPFGSNLKTEHYTENKEVRIIQLNNIGDFTWKNSGTRYTTFEHAETLERCRTYPEDIVITKMMPAGKAIVVPNIENVYVISSDCVRLRLPLFISNEYIVYMINSGIIHQSILKTVQGIGRTRTSLTKLKELLVPLPPYNEQLQIVITIKKIFDYLNIITEK